MADGRWRITVTPPDWGQDHLSLEAVVAFVDGELAPGPHARAVQHLERCPECTAQVGSQRQARSALRTAGGPSLPSTLLSSLRAIPQEAELPPVPAGLAMSADGQLVAIASSVRVPADQPGFRSSITTPQHHAHPRRPTRGGTGQRRRRVGTTVAVSGLVLGALALGASALSAGSAAEPAPTTPSVDRGVLGGASPGVLDARLKLGGPSGPGPAAFER